MDLRAALRSKSIPFHQSTNNEILMCCLFCVERGESADTRFRLGVNVATSKAQCFNCKWASRHAVEAIAARLRIVDVYVEGEAPKLLKVKHKLPEDFEIVDPNSKDEWHVKVFKYLHSRRISKKQVVDKEIGFSLVGRYAHRVIFPVKVKKKLEGFVARTFANSEPRYLNTSGLKTLYNYPDKEITSIVVLSEGIVKALNIERFLMRRVQDCDAITSIALLGHTMTEAQEELLFSKPFEELVLWPDPDVQGTKGFIALADKLSMKVRVSVPSPIPTKQADELDPAQLEYMFLNRVPFSENLALQLHNKALQRRSA